MICKILNDLASEYLSDLFYVFEPLRKNFRFENDHSILDIILKNLPISNLFVKILDLKMTTQYWTSY